MAGALEGIKIVDLTRVLAGPFCTMTLADLGADVIKIEGTATKDDTRFWGPPYAGGESAYYLCANRNKRAIRLNLKSDKGKEVFKRLVAESDVVVQNFKTGTLERMGLGYEQLKAVNPRIILASITGFGSNGPYKDLAGYDYIIQAMSGLMEITGDQQSGPMKVGVAIADVLTGLYTTVGILAAIQERNHSGVGQSIDISLFDSQISALVNVASNYLVSGIIPKRLGNQHPNIVPYQVFPTADQEMVVAVGNDAQFRKFVQVLGVEEWADDHRFATNPKRVENRELLIGMISERMKTMPSRHLREQLEAVGVPNGPINNMKELFADPQVQAREMVVEMAHPTAEKIKLVGSPLKLSRTPVEMKQHPPLYGEHTEQVLVSLGYTIEEIEEMQKNQEVQ
ncbi:CaiB/BaiF CoA transferase family protein [Ammoniphilus resinae]|uniref:Crotonobetainyl-CoA:carnitine CoA-transferase CaiB-like acyl-CoA transferase n=1 Tax=Ammoniphilus resinae TaxID=861532 RepID=A0ABS4GUG2_9BACL|nr:CaiB/BaiF CoA-transferase family protein [Ammoniphilus resinae]MBP1933904.1 crotonobetainyl-CoA:carnitine CoA-transferase CaiB-like acyl-CoA transferase [Ammoniphilus resinae]